MSAVLLGIGPVIIVVAALYAAPIWLALSLGVATERDNQFLVWLFGLVILVCLLIMIVVAHHWGTVMLNAWASCVRCHAS